MHSDERGRSRSADLESAIQQAIVTRTGGRIRSLEVEVTEDQVVIRARAVRYYDKQLALQALIDMVDTANGPRIELNIDVLDDSSSPEVKCLGENHNRQHLSGRDSDAHSGGHTSDRLLSTVGVSLPRLVSRQLVREFSGRALFRTHADVVPMEQSHAIERT